MSDTGSTQQWRARLIGEMGLGPVWRLRTPAARQAGGAVVPANLSGDAVAEPFIAATPLATSTSGPLVPAVSAETAGARARGADSGIPIETADGRASMDWQALQQAVANCTRCGLCASRNNTVFGAGDAQAEWLFIGEGPGRNEDREGEPFVGPAGKLLNNMMAAMGLQRGKNAFIANIVKCRPTDAAGRDRPPSPEEVAACLPFLQRQIALIKPRVLVALGKTAAVSLLGLDLETSLASLRGRPHSYMGLPLIVTYHPAYLLRAPEDKAKSWRDLCMALATGAHSDAASGDSGAAHERG